jgi:hypothetical protein
MPHPLNVIDHPVRLDFLERRAVSSWLEPAPFAKWLVAALRPRAMVELGAYYGTAYCAFCQAIEALGLSTHAFAVDTWEGDPYTVLAREGAIGFARRQVQQAIDRVNRSRQRRGLTIDGLAAGASSAQVAARGNTSYSNRRDSRDCVHGTRP